MRDHDNRMAAEHRPHDLLHFPVGAAVYATRPPVLSVVYVYFLVECNEGETDWIGLDWRGWGVVVTYLLVGSSSIRILLFRSSALARLNNCFCPCEKNVVLMIASKPAVPALFEIAFQSYLGVSFVSMGWFNKEIYTDSIFIEQFMGFKTACIKRGVYDVSRYPNAWRYIQCQEEVN